MLQSVISRLAFFCALALLVLAVPIFYLMTADASPLRANNQEASTLLADAAAADSTEIAAKEEPVVKLASLTVNPKAQTLEILGSLGARKSDTGVRVERASDLSKERRFDEALAILDGVHHASREDYSVKFMEARVLAWSGRHKKAEQAFRNLNAKYPEDLDIMVSYGYLKFYQRNYISSEKIFGDVLQLNPDYEDARRGLERTRQAINKL